MMEVIELCCMYFLHSISKILDHVYYHYLDFFFR